MRALLFVEELQGEEEELGVFDEGVVVFADEFVADLEEVCRSRPCDDAEFEY